MITCSTYIQCNVAGLGQEHLLQLQQWSCWISRGLRGAIQVLPDFAFSCWFLSWSVCAFCSIFTFVQLQALFWGVQLVSFLTFCTFYSSVALLQLLQAQGQRTDQEQAVRLWRQEAGLCEYLSYLCLKVIIFIEPWALVIGLTFITIANNGGMSERKMKH